MNKYHARRTWSELCQRWFASRGEATRAEELWLLSQAGVISDLSFQEKFIFQKTPRVSITIDFKYTDCKTGQVIYEDFKGFLTRDFRTKMAWLKEKYGVEVMLTQTSGWR